MKKILSAIIILFPAIAFAQANSLQSLVSFILNDIFAKGIIPLLILASLAVFFWGIVRFIWQSSYNPQSVAEGKWFMFWGITALFVMTSIWGLTAFIGDFFGIKNVLPQLSNGRSVTPSGSTAKPNVAPLNPASGPSAVSTGGGVLNPAGSNTNTVFCKRDPITGLCL